MGASRVAAVPGPWATWGDYLPVRLPAAPDWPERLARGDVLDAQGRPLRAHSPCVPGTVAWYWRALPPEPRVPFDIEVLHRCDRLVAVDKPHFLPVTPGGRYLQETVLVRLKRLLACETLVPLHRLDRETAGVLLFTVQPATRGAYHDVFRQRRVHKVYEAVAPWREGLAFPRDCSHRLEERPGRAFMQMQAVPGEPNARTRVDLLRRLQGGLAHYELHPLTGAKHQLRFQMAALGLPLLGDRIYPRLLPAEALDAPLDFSQPLQLLAREIGFTDPVTGGPRRFRSQRVLQALGDGPPAASAESAA